MLRSLFTKLERWLDGDSPGSTEAMRKWACRGEPYSSPNSAMIWEWQTDEERGRGRRAAALVESDPAQAFSLYRELAEAGSIWGMERAGWCLYNAIGTTRDVPEAKLYLEKAAAGGSYFAGTCLGWLAIKQGNLAEAERVLRNAVSAEHPPAMYHLARAYMKLSRRRAHRRVARELLERAAASGYVRAKTHLTVCLVHGRFGPLGMATGVWRLVALGHEVSSEFDRRARSRIAPGAG